MVNGKESLLNYVWNEQVGIPSFGDVETRMGYAKSKLSWRDILRGIKTNRPIQT
jgi:hypothetical protein